MFIALQDLFNVNNASGTIEAKNHPKIPDAHPELIMMSRQPAHIGDCRHMREAGNRFTNALLIRSFQLAELPYRAYRPLNFSRFLHYRRRQWIFQPLFASGLALLLTFSRPFLK